MSTNTRELLVRYINLAAKDAKNQSSKLSDEEEAEKQEILKTLDTTHEDAIASATNILSKQFED